MALHIQLKGRALKLQDALIVDVHAGRVTVTGVLQEKGREVRIRRDWSEMNGEERDGEERESRYPGAGDSSLYIQETFGGRVGNEMEKLNSRGFTRQSACTCPPPREGEPGERREAEDEANNVLVLGAAHSSA